MAETSSPSHPVTAEDWNKLWRAKQRYRSNKHGSEYWNARARTYTTKDNPNSYTARFLALANLAPTDTILDMGCGTGNLTVPLARAGHHVWAADFSSGMLAKLQEALEQEDLQDKVHILELAWDDDWEAAGIHKGQFDVCFASRSIATENLLDALSKLNGAARRRCCITLPYGISPRADDNMLADIGFTVEPSYDDSYAIAMLSALGQLPKLDYIPTLRNDTFQTREEAFARYHEMALEYGHYVHDRPSEADLDARINGWLDANLVPDARDPKLLTLAHPRESFWAFVSWEKREAQ